MPRHLERFGIDAILVTEPETSGDRLMAALASTPGVIEASAGACSVLLRFADWPAARAALPELRARRVAPLSPADGALLEIGVCYDGADLDAVAAECGLRRAEVIDLHLATTFVVAFCGFAPGFAYLAGLPDALRLPRLASPRPRVPAGSVAIADTWCGIYPRATPGGWRLLGRTSATLFDLDRRPPALLVPGTRVRFTVQP